MPRPASYRKPRPLQGPALGALPTTAKFHPIRTEQGIAKRRSGGIFCPLAHAMRHYGAMRPRTRTELGTGSPILLASAADATRLLGQPGGPEDREWLRILHLDRDGRVLAHAEQTGGRDELALDLGDIVRSACRLDATRVIIAHYHPGGDPRPSATDLSATRRLAGLLAALDMELTDHLIFARGGVTSFRGSGLL